MKTKIIKYGLVSIAALAIIATGAIVYINLNADSIIYKTAKTNIAKNMETHYEKDALEIIITGSGSPMNSSFRGDPSIVAMANSKVYLFDAGSGTQKAMRRDGIPLGDLENIFLTHYHSDHIADLGEVRLNSWTSGRKSPMKVYGPTGLNTVIEGVEKFYSLDTGYRIAHHSEEVIKYEAAPFAPHEFTLPNEGDLLKVYEDGDFKVYAFAVDHRPVEPAVGYRLEYKDKVVIYTGDTIYQDYLVGPCKGADVILANGLSHQLSDLLGQAAKEVGNSSAAEIFHDIQEYLMDPVDAAKLAQKSGAKHLVLVHVAPPLDTRLLERVYLRGVKDTFSGKVDIATDGMRIILR